MLKIIGKCKFKRNLMKVTYIRDLENEYLVKDLIRDLEFLKIKDLIVYNDSTFNYHKILGVCYSEKETHKLTFKLSETVIQFPGE